MRRLDQRGVAALEFCLVAVPLFTLMFVIFDLGRYTLTVQSLRMLANAGARAMMINNCYVNNVIKKITPGGSPVVIASGFNQPEGIAQETCMLLMPAMRRLKKCPPAQPPLPW